MILFGLDSAGALTLPTQLLLVFFLLVIGFLSVSRVVVQLSRKGGTAAYLGHYWDAIEVGRVLGIWPAGFSAFVGDACVAAAAVFFLTPSGQHLWTPVLGWDLLQADRGVAWIGAFALLAGHCFDPFFGFRGGRGTAPLLGCFAILSPFAALGAVCGSAICAVRCRDAELASLVGFLTAGIIHLIVIQKGTPDWIGLVLLLFIAYRHRADVARILDSRKEAS